MAYATWEEAARAQGWSESGAELRNDKLDRDWPDHDWQSAAEDAGVEGHEVDEENERRAERFYAGDRDFTPPYEP